MLAMCLSASAATDGSYKFYGAETASNVTIVPGTDNIMVTYSAAKAGAYYGIILVEGSELPTRDNAIFFIDQLTASAGEVAFNVIPKLPTESCELTLYISSNDPGEALISIPLKYGVDENATDSIIGDVNGDGEVAEDDLLRIAKYFSGFEVEIDEDASDVTGDGVVEEDDLLRLAKYFSGFDVVLGK